MPQEEIDGFVARLFDKNPLTARPNTLPLPYSIDNPPSSVRITILLIILQSTINILFWLVIQDLYPDWEIDVELSDEDNNGHNKSPGDDARGDGAPSVETLAPNPIGSSLAEESHPLAADRTTSTAHREMVERRNTLCLGPSASKTKL
jgi:hypothetical protein